jgi:hypothetical protein
MLAELRKLLPEEAFMDRIRKMTGEAQRDEELVC